MDLADPVAGGFEQFGGGVTAGERIAVSAIETPLNGMYVRTTDRPEPEEEQTDQVAAKDDANGAAGE